MKYLYYNPIEFPAKIRIKSQRLGIDVEYTPRNANNDQPVSFRSLFEHAAMDDIDDVQVYLTPHEQAYWKNEKNDSVGTRITGWISLKEYKNGGGYREDKCKTEIK